METARRPAVSSPFALVCLAGLVAAAGACGGLVDAPEDALPGLPAGHDAPAFAARGGSEPGPERVVSDVGVPSALAVTRDRVVFTTSATRLGGQLVEAGALFVADKRASAPLMLDVDRQGASYDALAVEGDLAIVATSDGRLLRVAVHGGDVAEVARLASPAQVLAASFEHVYAAHASGEIVRVALSGGEVEAVGTVGSEVRGLVADGGALFVAVAPSDGETSNGAIAKIDVATREVEILAADAGSPCAMARGGDRLFWTSSGSVLGLTLRGGAPATVARGSFGACALATDGTSLYFATTTPDDDLTPTSPRSQRATGLGLMRAPLAGGEPVAVAHASRPLARPGSVATDATHLYWLSDSGVSRLAK